MATAKFYMIYVDLNKESDSDKLEEVMNLSLDWYRVNDQLWIVYTTSDKDKWQSRLSPIVKPDGYMFICKLDTSDRQGWMKKGFWSWLRRENKDT